MDYRKLHEAAKAMERASTAAFLAIQYPHGPALPCKVQEAAANAEIECALRLIEAAKKAGCGYERTS